LPPWQVSEPLQALPSEQAVESSSAATAAESAAAEVP
jgi:hypothetical protein